MQWWLIQYQQIRQASARPSRKCAAEAGSYCELFLSDEEGSDFQEDSEGDDDEKCDPSSTKTFDQKRGKDEWIGRRVVKNFGSAGDFEGVVVGVDQDKNKKGYRLFLVYYFDDEDSETMWPEELNRYSLLNYLNTSLLSTHTYTTTGGSCKLTKN